MTHTKIKPKKVKGCACYGNNAIHPCFCSPFVDEKKNDNSPSKTKEVIELAKLKIK